MAEKNASKQLDVLQSDDGTRAATAMFTNG
jgi:hypothetical protein